VYSELAVTEAKIFSPTNGADLGRLTEGNFIVHDQGVSAVRVARAVGEVRSVVEGFRDQRSKVCRARDTVTRFGHQTA
jgi:hypothetical protein